MERTENQRLKFHHFSHEHPLEHTNSPPKQKETCAGCNLMILPGYDGWLYRCLICEFDTHISCAISNQTGLQPPQNRTPLLSTSAFPRQTMHSSASSFGISVAENYNIEGNELLQLVRQKVSRGNFKSIGEEKVASAAVTGWDERLYSPKQNFNVRVATWTW
ncbi:hypothetical protein Pyn_38726 [Prunus yedoensis var. nudiflora]|uniref:DC1 domain-containing protein n=1 Tax=Prunus yedoensis var. nudiflora TaxID=2094558 RepID=A0A314UVR2_PRUYE|nr:hypothetical protein Pyn_38726 [Prunus yedoensis var. nudiflora]